MGFVSGTGIRVLSAFFRLMQLVSAVIVTALVGRYLHFAHDAHAHAGSRLIYAEVLGGISILGALLLFFPWKGSFFAFPFDIIMFIMWIVAFGLLASLSRGCGSGWYRSSWSFLWGGWWRRVPVGNNNPTFIPGNACGRWRTVLAFAFIGAMFWLFSACLGLFKSTRRGDTEHRYKRTERVTETTQPVVSAPVVNRGNETTHGGPAYEANSNTFGPTQGTVREPGYVANTSNIGTNQGNIRSPGYVVHNDTLESTLGTARGTGLGAARDPGYSV